MLAACDRGPTIIICGGASNFRCPPEMYCKMGKHCGGIDNEGTCAIRPETCPLNVTPVCGCDRKTYDNACWAAAQGMSILHDRTCDSEG